MSNYAFVFARGGSKGLPGKNIKKLHGKPLLGYSIDVAKQSENIDKVFVSTDDKEIAEVALTFGAELIWRDEDLAQDDSPEWLSWQHAIKAITADGGSFDKFISLPATSPLRSVTDVDKCILALTEDTDVVVSVTEAQRSPYFNMVKLDENGDSHLVISPDSHPISRRQDVPSVYDMTTVAYVAKPDFILRNNNIFSGRVRSVIVPRERAVDIDTELDFIFAKVILDHAKGL